MRGSGSIGLPGELVKRGGAVSTQEKLLALLEERDEWIRRLDVEREEFGEERRKLHSIIWDQHHRIIALEGQLQELHKAHCERVAEDPVIVEEPANAEEPVSADEPLRLEQPVILEEPFSAEQATVVDDSARAAPPVVLEELASGVQPVIVEEPVTEEPPVVLEEPAIVEEPTSGGRPLCVDPPAVAGTANAAAGLGWRLLRAGYRRLRAVARRRNCQCVLMKPELLAPPPVEVAEREDALSESMEVQPIEVEPIEVEPIEFEPVPVEEPMPAITLEDPPRFLAFDQIDVSIVIAVRDQWRDTLACLESIARETRGVNYEVIAIDDGSSDETQSVLGQVEGLLVIKNAESVGVVESRNRGAAVARGAFLVFLNQHSMVTDGWLETLRATFRREPEVGCVGPTLVLADGRLANAGGAVWSDASISWFGSGKEAGHPRFRFLREVDTCSADCLMMARDLFEQLGGFDGRYAGGSYEALDMAFKVRKAGYKVIYQPMARVVTDDSSSAGRELEPGAAADQVMNQAKFLDRWHGQLLEYAAAPRSGVDRDQYIRECANRSRTRVMVMDHRLPAPDRDSGSFRMMQVMLALLRKNCSVSFVPDDLTGWPGYLEELEGAGVEVIHEPYYPAVLGYLREHGHEFDMAILSRAEVTARQMTFVRYLARRATLVYDTVDLHFLREERQASVTEDPELKSAIAERKRKELRLALRADITLVVSPVEKAIMERECPETNVKVLSNIYPFDPTAKIAGPEGRRDILFIGSFQHMPNPDAVLYFAREILPLIQEKHPDVVFRVIGPDAPAEILELASPGIEILGHVPDVGPWFERSRVTVAPLRFGAGVKGKVNQSMALGVPTVVTSIAAEGMSLVDGENCLIGDDPVTFANATIRLLEDDRLWTWISTGGRENVRLYFSVEAADRQVEELLGEIAGRNSQAVAGQVYSRAATSLAG